LGGAAYLPAPSGSGMRVPQMKMRNHPNTDLLVSFILEKIDDSISHLRDRFFLTPR
jgi:hypothetical protein